MSYHAEVMAKLKSLHPEAHSWHAISDTPASTTASEALRLWRTRLKNTSITHKEIVGLPKLVQRLEKITPQKKVDYFAFSADQAAITLLFEKASGKFLGSAFVEK